MLAVSRLAHVLKRGAAVVAVTGARVGVLAALGDVLAVGGVARVALRDRGAGVVTNRVPEGIGVVHAAVAVGIAVGHLHVVAGLVAGDADAVGLVGLARGGTVVEAAFNVRVGSAVAGVR